jgi:hypothetical protein
MTHRAIKVPSKLFTLDTLPHWAMLVLFLTWFYFQITLGTAGVPPPLNQAFAAISGLWFSYLLQFLSRRDVKEMDIRVTELTEVASAAHPELSRQKGVERG